jgi:hypothetical protein
VYMWCHERKQSGCPRHHGQLPHAWSLLVIKLLLFDSSRLSNEWNRLTLDSRREGGYSSQDLLRKLPWPFSDASWNAFIEQDVGSRINRR